MGLSFGGKGFRYSVSTSGRRTTTIGLPGTGLSYSRTKTGGNSSKHSGVTKNQSLSDPIPLTGSEAANALPKPGWFAPGYEKRFHEGLKAYLNDDLPKALQAFEAASTQDSRNVADDFFAGLVATRLDVPENAIRYLERVVESEVSLPDALMQKYLPADRTQLQLTVEITSRIKASVGFDSLGAALILAERYQETGQREKAIGLLQQLDAELGDELVLKLSLADLLYEDGDDEGVIEATAGIRNSSELGLACLYLKAQALARQGLTNAAIETLTVCLSRTAGRDPELLKEVRYDRARLYAAIGQMGRARRDWERLYAEDPKYRDVATRLKGGGVEAAISGQDD